MAGRGGLPGFGGRAWPGVQPVTAGGGVRGVLIHRSRGLIRRTNSMVLPQQGQGGTLRLAFSPASAVAAVAAVAGGTEPVPSCAADPAWSGSVATGAVRAAARRGCWPHAHAASFQRNSESRSAAPASALWAGRAGSTAAGTRLVQGAVHARLRCRCPDSSAGSGPRHHNQAGAIRSGRS